MTGGGGHVDQAEDDWVRRAAWGLPIGVVPMPGQLSLRPVPRRPPGCPVPGSVAPDLDVTAACIPRCRAIASGGFGRVAPEGGEASNGF